MAGGEGELSGVDKHLIELSLLALDAGRRNALNDKMDAAARWRSEIGIPHGEEAVLVTPITYRPFDIASPEEYTAMLERRRLGDGRHYGPAGPAVVRNDHRGLAHL